MNLRQRRIATTTATVMLLTMALLSQGCASPARKSSPTTRPDGNATLAAAPPTSERGREIGRLSKRSLGFLNVAAKRAGWWINDVADNLTGETPARYARMMESANPDARRAGINWLAGRPFGERPPYTTRYAQIAGADPDPLVRATAIRALNRSRDRGATAVYVKALSDPIEQIRLEGAKALNRTPDPEARDALLKLLRKPDESKDVRIAAADALKHHKNLEVARALASFLGDRDFGIAWQSHRSLRDMTGRDLRYDEGAWLTFLTGPEKPLG